MLNSTSAFIPEDPSSLDASTMLKSINGSSVVVATLIVALAIFFAPKSRKGKMPPGPKGLPLVGNVFQLSDENWLTFTEWKWKYGPIVGLNLGGRPTIVLNTHKAASDILDVRAAIYSDRPGFIVAGDLLCGGLLLVFTRYGDMWRRMRRAAHEGLYANAAQHYFTLQETEATVLVDGLLKTPDDYDEHLKRTAASQIMAMVYDTLPIKNHLDPMIVRVNDLVQRLVKSAYPGEHLVEFFPWMQRLPRFLTPWRTWAEDWHKKDSELFEGYFNAVKDRVEAGDERPSFVSNLVKRKHENKFTNRENSWIAGVMISAGAETTAAVMSWFMLAMILNPDIQRKCQEEIDNVVGRERMPNFGDFESLPYIRATVREILRWRPVDPIGLQHQSIADDVYEGYFIPKGTLVIANVWAMNRDPDLYGEDFDSFRPDRFLDDEGKLKPTHPTTKGEGHVTYGFGRRICVGRYVANNTLFIDIAHLLWACTIEKARDENGEYLQYDDHANHKEGLVVRPRPFKLSMKARFPEAVGIVAEAKERLVAEASIR